jgi:adenine-specific DNA-methyltransferase
MQEHKSNLKNTNQLNINNSSYEQLKEYYDNHLNVDRSSFKTSNDECTPIGCVEEMLSKLPQDLWSKPNLKILDPCCGNGNFHLFATKKLLEAGRTKEEIVSSILHFNEINEDRVENVKSIFGTDVNLTKQDFLTYDEEQKYDLVYANPPFAKFTSQGKRASKNHTLTRDFISKSIKVLKPDGYLVYIVPDNWMSLADRNSVIKEITEYKFLHLDIHGAKKWFPKIGSSFTWMAVQKSKATGSYSVKCKFSKREWIGSAKNEDRSFIPLLWNNQVQSIFAKTIEAQNERFKVETTSDLHKYTKKDLISTDLDSVFKWRLIHTPRQTVYASRPHKYQGGFKCFISTTDKYKTFVDDCGMTQSIAFVRCESEQEAIITKNILDHDLYKFLNNLCRWGNFNNIRILQKFPIPCDPSNIYKSFGITKGEIQFIQQVLN